MLSHGADAQVLERLERLERLYGDRKGQHSIRINELLRVCFRWEAGYADDVEITNYH